MTTVLETERLLLRHMVPEDLDFLAALLGHPEVMRYYPHTHTREQSQQWLDKQLARYERDGHGLFLAIDKESAEPVGQMGLAVQEVDGLAELEIGYLVHRPYWRRGYASEAACGLRDHAFHVMDRNRVISLIRPINIPSQGVARKMGMTMERHTEFKGFDHWVFARSRS